MRELSVDILFEGDFEQVYRNGDNRHVLPTDTMKNAVYVIARKLVWGDIETFAAALANYFLDSIKHVSQVSLNLEQVPWAQIGQHTSAFLQTGNERRTAHLVATRSTQTSTSGLKGLQILKTADSAFSGFLKDSITTLPETNDRLFGTVLEAEWNYLGTDIDFDQSHERIRNVLLDSFAQNQSLSVQHTLFAMGSAVLDLIDTVASIHLVMPNKHCLLFDLARFGLENNNQIFVPTDEPSGYIQARLAR